MTEGRAMIEGRIPEPLWTRYAPEALARLAEQAVGLPVTVDFDRSRVVGEVVAADGGGEERGVLIVAEVDREFAGRELGTLVGVECLTTMIREPNLEGVSVMTDERAEAAKELIAEEADEAQRQAALRDQKEKRSRVGGAEAQTPDPDRLEGK